MYLGLVKITMLNIFVFLVGNSKNCIRECKDAGPSFWTCVMKCNEPKSRTAIGSDGKYKHFIVPWIIQSIFEVADSYVKFYMSFSLLIYVGNTEIVKMCDKPVTEKYLKHASLTIDPNPIVLKGGARISLSFGLELLKEIPVGTKASLKFTNHAGDKFLCLSPSILKSVSKNYPRMNQYYISGI